MAADASHDTEADRPVAPVIDEWFTIDGQTRHGHTPADSAAARACFQGLDEVQGVWLLSAPPQLKLWARSEETAQQIEACLLATGVFRELKPRKHLTADLGPRHAATQL